MKGTFVIAFATLLALQAQTLAADGNSARGQRVFGACAACHSLQPDKSMTGPSLSEVWDRKAGSVASFSRYSSALKSANIEWNDKTLDEWIKDPQHVVPGNEMTFPGIKDAQQRADLLAFLKEATKKGSGQTAQQGGQMGGMVDERDDGWWPSSQSQKAVFGATCANNHVLQRHLHGHNCKWPGAPVLGTQSSLKD